MMAATPAEHCAQPGRQRPWSEARRILAVRLDNLGDVLMTTPALAALKGGAGGAAARELTLLASPAAAALAPHIDATVDEVIAFDAPWVKGSDVGAPGLQDAGDAAGAAERRLLDGLAARRFDAAVIFTVCTQSALPAALWCRLAGIGLRLAVSRENPYRLLTDWVPESDFIDACSTPRHEVRRQLDLVGRVGFRTDDERLRFRCRAADLASAHRHLAAAGIDAARPFVALHLGSSAASRRYPPERFGEAATLIAAQSGLPILLLAGPGEQPLLQRARAAMRAPVVVLDEPPSLGELGALLQQASVVVCNNSGPAHIAAAVGTPVVVLYALTNPQHTPWQVPARVLSHDVPCRNCLKSVCPEGHHACLLGVMPREVADAALELLLLQARSRTGARGPRAATALHAD